MSIPAYCIDSSGVPTGEMFGCLPETPDSEGTYANFSDVTDVIPQSQWDALLETHGLGLEPFVRKIKNQKQEGTCASNATCSCQEIVFYRETGVFVELSPISIYRWIAPNPRTGSNIGTNLKQLSEVGALPVSSEENKSFLGKAGLNVADVLTATNYYQLFPTNWKETAKHFQAFEWVKVNGFIEMASAVLKGWPVNYGRSGHAITGTRLVKQNGVWCMKYANSWGAWGDNGYGYDSQAYINRSGGGYGAWALRATQLTEPILRALK